MWIGNDLEMSGVLWSTSFWIAKERSLLSLAKVVIRGRTWAFLCDFRLKSLVGAQTLQWKGKKMSYLYSRCERLRLTSCFHFCSHQSGTDSPLMIRIGWRFLLVVMRSSAFSSVKFRLYIPEYAVAVPQVLPKVYLHTSIEVFSVGCMIKGIPVVPLGRFDTIGSMQIFGYWYCLKML